MMREGTNTPWGPAQLVQDVGPGVENISTASHGGLHVTGAAAKAVPAAAWAVMMNGRGWAEEDCEAVIVLSLLIDAGHVTNQYTLSHAALIRDHARKVVKTYGRYRGIKLTV